MTTVHLSTSLRAKAPGLDCAWLARVRRRLSLAADLCPIEPATQVARRERRSATHLRQEQRHRLLAKAAGGLVAPEGCEVEKNVDHSWTTALSQIGPPVLVGLSGAAQANAVSPPLRCPPESQGRWILTPARHPETSPGALPAWRVGLEPPRYPPGVPAMPAMAGPQNLRGADLTARAAQ